MTKKKQTTRKSKSIKKNKSKMKREKKINKPILAKMLVSIERNLFFNKQFKLKNKNMRA